MRSVFGDVMARAVSYTCFVVLAGSCSRGGAEAEAVGIAYLNFIDSAQYAHAYLLLATPVGGGTRPSFLQFAARLDTIRARIGTSVRRKGSMHRDTKITFSGNTEPVWSGKFNLETQNAGQLTEVISVRTVNGAYRVDYYDILPLSSPEMDMTGGGRLPGVLKESPEVAEIFTLFERAKLEGGIRRGDFLISPLETEPCGAPCQEAEELVDRAFKDALREEDRRWVPLELIARFRTIQTGPPIYRGFASFPEIDSRVVLIEVPAAANGQQLPFTGVIYFEGDEIVGADFAGVRFGNQVEFYILAAPTEH